MPRELAPVRAALLVLAASPLRAAVIVAPQAPAALTPIPALTAPSASFGSALPAPALAVPSLTPASIPGAPFAAAPAPLALQAVPLLAAAVDSKKPAEASSAAGERLVALLQGARDPLKRVAMSEIAPGVISLRFPSQRLMATTMVRFQEHYESPKFRGKAFTRAEFDAWYESQDRRPGDTTYYKYWDGFNVPSRVLARFKKGGFDPLDEKERALLAKFADRKGRFYVIATKKKDADSAVLRHEVAHGLWYTRPEYRRRARAILKDVDLKPVFAMLERLGYHRSVWLDEAHAWIGDGAGALRGAGLRDPRPYREAKKKLLALQKEYVSGIF